MAYNNKHKCPIKRAYYQQVWDITELNNKNVKNIELRGLTFHLDHIIPISFGFYYNISPNIIGDVNNLRIVSFKDNFNKNQQITEDVKLKFIHFGINPEKLVKIDYKPKVSKKNVTIPSKQINVLTENQSSLLYYTRENQSALRKVAKINNPLLIVV